MTTDEQLAAVIKGLPPRLRDVFVMVTLQRKSFTDIARELHMSQRRVERRMVRALVACRRRLGAR